MDNNTNNQVTKTITITATIKSFNAVAASRYPRLDRAMLAGVWVEPAQCRMSATDGHCMTMLPTLDLPQDIDPILIKLDEKFKGFKAKDKRVKNIKIVFEYSAETCTKYDVIVEGTDSLGNPLEKLGFVDIDLTRCIYRAKELLKGIRQGIESTPDLYQTLSFDVEVLKKVLAAADAMRNYDTKSKESIDIIFANDQSSATPILVRPNGENTVPTTGVAVFMPVHTKGRDKKAILKEAYLGMDTYFKS